MFAQKELNDNSIMPWGMHKGKKMANVPAKYLLYLLQNGCSDPYVRAYIVENVEALQAEIKNQTTYNSHK